MRAISQIDLQQAQQAAREQAGSHEEHRRQRDFADDERPAHVPSAGEHAAAVAGQGLTHVHATGLSQRGPREQQRGSERNAERDREHARVQADRSEVWHSRRRRCLECLEAPQPDQHAECAAGDREQQALGEQLARQAPSRRPKGDSHRNLSAARLVPSQREVGDVRAADQEQQRDRAQEGQQGRADVADHRLVSGVNRKLQVAFESG